MINASVDFSKKVREWDGFGVNYVETCQTRDYSNDAQDYGGFSILAEEKRQQILDMIFGEEGLKPGIVKMFLDPFHQKETDQNKAFLSDINLALYDHTSTTRWMRYFVQGGLERSRKDSRDLQILATLYGPPGWMTKQRIVRGRDLDPRFKTELAKYMVSWVKYLQHIEKLPVKYLSLHNEGEDIFRWAEDGCDLKRKNGHDYNLYWPAEQVVEFIKIVKDVLDANSMQHIGVTPGELYSWYKLADWGYSYAIADDEEALNKLGLVTCHGFIKSGYHAWSADARSVGIDILRELRPDLHSWTTSISWADMDAKFLEDLRRNIYGIKVNGIIPWACIQWQGKWKNGDPNSGTAFRVYDDGSFSVEPGYYWYKQVCNAGQPGMGVARAFCNDAVIGMMAFSSNGTGNRDAFVVINTSEEDKEVYINVQGIQGQSFEAYRTSSAEMYQYLGEIQCINGHIQYTAPGNSAATFYKII